MFLLICAATTIINSSGEPWNDQDRRNVTASRVHCKREYNDCLKKFIKKKARTYHAICGGKKDGKKDI